MTGPFGLPMAMMGFGMKLFETGAGASAVIARRSAMLAQAMLDPARLADPEFTRMVLEKTEAAGEAWLAAARHAARPAATDAAALAASSLTLAEGCLAPYHRRVRANGRRLGRKTARRH